MVSITWYSKGSCGVLVRIRDSILVLGRCLPFGYLDTQKLGSPSKPSTPNGDGNRKTVGCRSRGLSICSR